MCFDGLEAISQWYFQYVQAFLKKVLGILQLYTQVEMEATFQYIVL